MAVLYRPITNTFKDTYEIAEYKADEQYHEFMENLPLNIVLGTSLFFWNLENALLHNLTEFLKTETAKMTNKTILANGDNLTKNGIGTTAYIELAAEISKNLVPLQKYPYIKPLPSFRTLRKKTKLKQTSATDKLEKQKVKS